MNAQATTPFAEYLSDGRIRCKACQRRCLLEADALGFCGVRRNEGGRQPHPGPGP